MNFNLLVTKINILFIISLAFFFIVLLAYIDYEDKKFQEMIDKDYAKLSNYIFTTKALPFEIEEFMESHNFELAHDYNDRWESQRLVEKSKFISVGLGYEQLIYKNQRYLHFHSNRYDFMFIDNNQYKKDRRGFFIIVAGFLGLIISFLWILKSLRPLTKLKDEIQKFAKGELEINCKSDKKDEIAQISNEFDHAVKEIKLLLDSRQLFLRTVMHELKTPIAKGRIVSELLDDEKQKTRMVNVFENLNFIVNDFAKIEQLVSKNYEIKKYNYSVKEVIDYGIDMLMLDNPYDKIIIKDLADRKVKVDIDLCSMAVKNIIDNGIKYSIDKKIEIRDEDDILTFISKGEPLEKSLKEYFKPFHTDTYGKNHGMGLGLYIVKSILDMHQLKLKYMHKDGYNIFQIVP